MEALGAALTAVAVLCSLTGVLAVCLVIAERYLADYGPCEVVVNRDRELTVKGGGSLLAALVDNGIFIPSACGGKGTCGYCRVKVHAGGGPVLPTEEPYLSSEERAGNVRLSCSVRVRNDVDVEIPEELLAIREYETRVESITDLTHDVKEVTLSLVSPSEMKFTAGQYVQFRIPAYGDSPEPVYRAYSIASPPSSNTVLEFVIRLAPGGIATTYIFNRLRQGDSLLINGPYGEFALQQTQAEAIFVAGATGIAPIRSMLRTMVEEQSTRKATLYFGVLKKRDLFYADLLSSLENELADFRFVPALSAPDPEDEWDGETGLITEVIDRNVPKDTQAEAYLCGGPGMIDACLKVLAAKGIPKERILFDKF